ncbi:UDP-glucuronosyltransferase 1-1 [Halocaridina rubra]|uniref:UDP-glucuronosyltransferase 1-1 n=1 Tax=Halocaridina rubra TaxID=373956 RepID=A0AAN8X7X0_HALRR
MFSFGATVHQIQIGLHRASILTHTRSGWSHGAIRVFVTHCGKHSASESVYHGVPILGLPITFDQPRNCARLARRGEGIVIQWEDLTPEAIVKAMHTLVHDDRYRKRVQGVANRLQAQKETGLERAVWWVEYVMEYGNDNLRFSGADLTLAQYLLLDVLAILGTVAFVIGIVVFLLGRSLLRRFWPSLFTKNKLD